MVRQSLCWAVLLVAGVGILVPAVASAQLVKSEETSYWSMANAPVCPGGGPLARAACREASRLAGDASGSTIPPQRKATRRGWIARHPILSSTLIGASAGTILGYAEARSSSKEGPPNTGEGMVLLGLLGAGVGAVTGVVIDAAVK